MLDFGACGESWIRRVTDKLASYSGVKAEVMPGIMHGRDKGANHHAENRISQRGSGKDGGRRFKTLVKAQWFLSAISMISNYVRPGCHLLKADHYREILGDALPMGVKFV